MNYVNIIIPFVGGLGMFIYGMQIMAQGLENAAGNKMKTLLEVLTKNKLMGVQRGGVVIDLSFLFCFNLSVLQANDALLGAVLQLHDNAHVVWLVRLEIVHRCDVARLRVGTRLIHAYERMAPRLALLASHERENGLLFLHQRSDLHLLLRKAAGRVGKE